ncbi:MAG: sirohydrochlorin chelatase [Promethearchaeota archaeon]
MMTNVVLAMHGMPPLDFPENEVMELVRLHRALEKSGAQVSAEMKSRFGQLDKKMRAWPRTPENDPFWASSNKLAEALQAATGLKVVVGYNEFCGPSISEALELAVSNGADRVLVVTPMMTPGGEHSEHDIPEAIELARACFTHVKFEYVWPFPVVDIVSFLTSQINSHMKKPENPRS